MAKEKKEKKVEKPKTFGEMRLEFIAKNKKKKAKK